MDCSSLVNPTSLIAASVPVCQRFIDMRAFRILAARSQCLVGRGLKAKARGLHLAHHCRRLSESRATNPEACSEWIRLKVRVTAFIRLLSWRDNLAIPLSP